MRELKHFKPALFFRPLFALFCLTALPACAQIKYPAQMTLKVTDDTGAPVPAGFVRASTFSYWERGEGFGQSINDHYTAPINKDGVAVLEGPSLRGSFSYGVYPVGNYYPGAGGYYKFKEVVNGRWEQWNPQLEIIVPRILNPIPLFARRLEAIELPSAGPVGFDMVVSDWVAPYGKGERADFIYEVKTIVPMIDPAKAFESILTVTFINRGDGIQSRLASPIRRLLELPREAPEDRYEPKLIKRIARAAEGASLEIDRGDDQNYFFRVRTVFDSNGKAISALYGKILGDIAWDTLNSPKGHLRFTYYLNPTSLDRNLEFDPKRNLFPDTVSGTNISEP